MKRVRVPGVENIITVCSAKGGVGKSTTSVNVALALKNIGHRVGIVDADITGPSIPAMMSVTQAEVDTYRISGIDRFVPPNNFGLKVMSMGLLVPYDEAVAVRGPMLNKYIRALMFQTDWGELDYLVVDMPPGTNDVHITITQEVSLTGAVIVSTPQHIALIDCRRGIEMFASVQVPVLGLVENMSYFICDQCTKRHYLFGEGGVKRTCAELNLPFLGEIPYNAKIMAEMDKGTPSTLGGDETLEHAKPYYDLARNIVASLGRMKVNEAPTPSISFSDPAPKR